jgi:Na+-transporting NADH:ubiquinone oxidoreductase subunit NqrD
MRWCCWWSRSCASCSAPASCWVSVLPLVTDGGWYVPNGMMLLAPSALFLIGLLIWALRTWKPALQEKD